GPATVNARSAPSLRSGPHGLSFVVQSITSRPIERAVPRTERIADSTDSQFRSGSFSLAISATCFAVTVPTLSLFGTPDPLAMFAARLSSTAAGGVFVMNEYDRSE